MAGKGDTPRPVDWGKWAANFDRIFRREPPPPAPPKPESP